MIDKVKSEVRCKMEARKVTNKEGEVLTTKEGKELIEYRFTPSDEFIPEFNKVLEKTKKVVIKGKEKTITNYTLKCRCKDQLGADVNGGEPIFVTLTPAQATSIGKKVSEGIELNQHVFVAYNYDSKDYGKQIGIGFKQKNKPPITF